MTTQTIHSNTSPQTRSRRGSFAYLRNLFSYSANLYLFVLAVYLILRLIYRDSLWWLAFFNNFSVFYFLAVAMIAIIAALIRQPVLLLRTAAFLIIGLVWFAPPFFPKSVAPAAGDTIKIVTFNLWAGNRQTELIDTWIAEQSPDLLFTQETVIGDSFNNLPELGDDYTLLRNTSLSGSGWGNVAQSRYEVLEDDALTYSERSQRFVAEIDGQQVAVYHVHFNVPMAGQPNLNIPVISTRLAPFFFYNDSSRNRQVAGLVEQLKSEPLPFIVTGDFNLSDQAMPYWDLASVAHDSFREVGNGLGFSWSVIRHNGQRVPLLPPQVRIDYVWHSDHFRAISAEQGPYLGSDHLPLVVTLAWR